MDRTDIDVTLEQLIAHYWLNLLETCLHSDLIFGQITIHLMFSNIYDHSKPSYVNLKVIIIIHGMEMETDRTFWLKRFIKRLLCYKY